MRAQICLRGGMKDKFIIPLNGLTVGKNDFFWRTGKEFFEDFENSEILDSRLDVTAVAEKSGRYVGVDCEVSGYVTVECDRCLDELELPVDVEIRLSVKYGEEAVDELQTGEREIVFVPEDCAELDMGQIVYDYVCTSLPMQRMHAEGDCNPAVLEYFGNAEEEAGQTDADGQSNPFAALKDMFR